MFELGHLISKINWTRTTPQSDSQTHSAQDLVHLSQAGNLCNHSLAKSPLSLQTKCLDFLNRFNTYEDPQQWSNFEKLRFLVKKKKRLNLQQKYHHFGMKILTDYGILTPYWTSPVKVINGSFLRTLHFFYYPVVATHGNQTMSRGFLMVRYPLKRPLSVGLNVGIHLSSTFQRAFFHSSKHFLILAWWMRKRWNHLGCLFELVRTFFGKYDLRPVSGHCLRKLLLCLDFGLSNGI